MGQLTILPGGASAGTLRGPIYDDRLSTARFDGVAVEQWMWSKDGLALRPGVDLMVYAVGHARYSIT